MKLIDRVASAAESLALACLGATLLWLSLSGKYASFVPPSTRPGIVASGVLLLACSLALSSTVGSGDLEHAGSRSSRRALARALVAFLASVLLFLPFHVSPSELASSPLGARAADTEAQSASDTDPSTDQPPTDSGSDADGSADSADPHPRRGGSGDGASSAGTLELTTDNFFAQVEELSSHGRAHDGQHIELVGFVMSTESARGQASIPRITQRESFAVARMAIWCCAADAYAIGFAVRWDGTAPEADSWVRVSGTLRARGTKALVIEADSVEVTSAPHPEFVVQTK
ncbi:hypothetical protein ADJ76_02385 [Schaalia meyeri]|uniref:TIGR03943 family putative permease subunit n=1 Tax=Schaalia meyeri TaxID=52773 RepID=UPI0006805824|nr:TIGR03943 family protein [Schaalia meyeri]AKU65874.1 hypothetical protein ADJ76_02385 [Schaalia meyeri]